MCLRSSLPARSWSSTKIPFWGLFLACLLASLFTVTDWVETGVCADLLRRALRNSTYKGVRIHEMGREELKCNAVARETPADLTRSSSVPSGLSCHTARGSALYMPSSTLQRRQVWEVGGGNMWPWARWLSSAEGKSWREVQLGPINHQHCQQLGTESLSLKVAWGSGPQPPPQRGEETCLRSHSQ